MKRTIGNTRTAQLLTLIIITSTVRSNPGIATFSFRLLSTSTRNADNSFSKNVVESINDKWKFDKDIQGLLYLSLLKEENTQTALNILKLSEPVQRKVFDELISISDIKPMYDLKTVMNTLYNICGEIDDYQDETANFEHYGRYIIKLDMDIKKHYEKFIDTQGQAFKVAENTHEFQQFTEYETVLKKLSKIEFDDNKTDLSNLPSLHDILYSEEKIKSVSEMLDELKTLYADKWDSTIVSKVDDENYQSKYKVVIQNENAHKVSMIKAYHSMLTNIITSAIEGKELIFLMKQRDVEATSENSKPIKECNFSDRLFNVSSRLKNNASLLEILSQAIKDDQNLNKYRRIQPGDSQKTNIPSYDINLSESAFLIDQYAKLLTHLVKELRVLSHLDNIACDNYKPALMKFFKKQAVRILRDNRINYKGELGLLKLEVNKADSLQQEPCLLENISCDILPLFDIGNLLSSKESAVEVIFGDKSSGKVSENSDKQEVIDDHTESYGIKDITNLNEQDALKKIDVLGILTNLNDLDIFDDLYELDEEKKTCDLIPTNKLAYLAKLDELDKDKKTGAFDDVEKLEYLGGLRHLNKLKHLNELRYAYYYYPSDPIDDEFRYTATWRMHESPSFSETCTQIRTLMGARSSCKLEIHSNKIVHVKLIAAPLASANTNKRLIV